MSQNLQIIDANTVVGAHSAHKMDITADDLTQGMDKYRISSSLTLCTSGISYCYAEGNAMTLDAIGPTDRLVPIATINPKNYFGGPSDIAAIKSRGFKIFKFYPADQGWNIDSVSFGAILDQLAPLNVPIMIDAGRPGDPTAAGLMVSSYPAPVILCSVSLGILSEALCVMGEHPNIMIETHELHAPGALELIANRVGADRIVFGSGAPTRSIASSLYYITSAGLSDDAKTAILGGNIARVLEVE